MAEMIIDALMADFVDALQTGLSMDLANRVTYPPPDQAPQELTVWLDYAGAAASASQFEEVDHTVVATVAVPYKGGMYPWSYRIVTNAAQLVRRAMRRHPVLANEAVVMSVVQSRAFVSAYAGVEAAIVAATVTWHLETKSDLAEEA